MRDTPIRVGKANIGYVGPRANTEPVLLQAYALYARVKGLVFKKRYLRDLGKRRSFYVWYIVYGRKILSDNGIEGLDEIDRTLSKELRV